MKIFSEIYGAYFRVAEKILAKKSSSRKDILSVISRSAFRDSALFIPDKIIPDSNGISPWGLLKNDGKGNYTPVTKKPAPQIVTALQKRWLKTKLSDPRTALFLDDNAFGELETRLADVKSLYDRSSVKIFDAYSDGDNYSDKQYRKHFKAILRAVREREMICISFDSRKGERVSRYVLPLNIEYSAKNDKFRIQCMNLKEGEPYKYFLINVGRITEIRGTSRYYDKPVDMNALFSAKRCIEPVTLEVTPERNGVERFMMEFASFEKRTELDLETGVCRVTLWYDKQDETELLIMLLGFGPVIRITGSESFLSLVRERVRKQYNELKDYQTSQ